MYARIKTPEDIYKYHIPLIAKEYDIEYEGGGCNACCPENAWYFLPAKMEPNIYWRGPLEGYNSSYWNDGLTQVCKYITTTYHEAYPGFCAKHKCKKTHKKNKFPLRRVELKGENYMCYVIYEDLYDGANQIIMFPHNPRVYEFNAGYLKRKWVCLSDYLEEHDKCVREREISIGIASIKEI